MVINRTTEKIVGLFLANPTKDYNIRELALATKTNYRLVYEEALQLEKINILSVKRKGGMNLCMLNLSLAHQLYTYIESLRRETFSHKHHFLKVIEKELLKVPTVFSIAILFGSYVLGKERKGSDIDLLFVVPNAVEEDQFKKEVAAALQVLSYPLDIQVIQERSFLEMRRQQDLNIVRELIPNHIIIYGAEAYYKLLSR